MVFKKGDKVFCHQPVSSTPVTITPVLRKGVYTVDFEDEILTHLVEMNHSGGWFTSRFILASKLHILFYG